MYNSPIDLIQENLGATIDNEILTEVTRVGVNVDRDELLKALQYDRDQYEKGYKEGYNRGREEVIDEILSEVVPKIRFLMDGYGHMIYAFDLEIELRRMKEKKDE